MFLIGPVAAAAIPAIGNVLGGILGNRAARKESQRNRQFQERMRNTQWQASVADMTAAGLNPALAYSQGGAASPGGSTAAQSDVLSEGVSSAMQMALQRKQMSLLDEQTKVAKWQASKEMAESSMKNVERDFSLARLRFYFDENGGLKPAMRELLRQTHSGQMAGSARQVSEAELAKYSVPERRALAELFESIGGGGKGVQVLGPLLLSLLRGR